MSSQPDNNKNNRNKPTIPSVFDHDCERPACADVHQMFHQQKQKTVAHPLSATGKDTVNNVDNQPTSVINSHETRKEMSECPLDSRSLGRASWSLLHSMVRRQLYAFPAISKTLLGSQILYFIFANFNSSIDDTRSQNTTCYS